MILELGQSTSIEDRAAGLFATESLIASFGGFIMLPGAYQQELRFPEDAAQKIKDMRNQLASYQEAEDKVKKLRQEGARIFEQVLQ